MISLFPFQVFLFLFIRFKWISDMFVEVIVGQPFEEPGVRVWPGWPGGGRTSSKGRPRRLGHINTNTNTNTDTNTNTILYLTILYLTILNFNWFNLKSRAKRPRQNWKLPRMRTTVCARIHICIYTYIGMYIYTYMHISTCIHVYIYIYMLYIYIH